MTVNLPLRRRLLGAVRHPVTATRVLVWRWRSDPARLAYSVRRLVTASAPVAGRLLRRRTGSGSARAGSRAALLGAARSAWLAGDWRVALETAPPGSARHTRYAGELAAVGPDPVPAGPGGSRPIAPVADRVLHVVTNSLPDTQAGYTVRTQAVATAQRALGLEPHVATRWGYPVLEGHFDPPRTLELDGVRYHRLLPTGAIPLRLDERLRRHADALTELARSLRPSVLHAATPHLNATPALAAGRRCGIPVVYEVRGFLEESWASADPARYATDQYRLNKARETMVMQAADVVVTLAETMAADIAGRGVHRDRIAVVPNAVDADLLSAAPDRAGMRRQLGIDDGEFVVGSVSSLNHYEGFGTLLAAAALLRDEGRPVRVLLVGGGAEQLSLRAQADQLGLGGTVLMPGRVPRDRAPAAVAALDVMVVPRIDAPVCRLVTPLKPIEAMALGVPVIASNLPALAEVLAAGGAGVLVPPDEPAALAGAIDQIRDDPVRRAEIVAAARQEVTERRTWQAAARAYRDLYQRLADLGDQGSSAGVVR